MQGLHSIMANPSLHWISTERLGIITDISYGSLRVGMGGKCRFRVTLTLANHYTNSWEPVSPPIENVSWLTDRVVSREVCLSSKALLNLHDTSVRHSRQRFGSVLLDLTSAWITLIRIPVIGFDAMAYNMMDWYGGQISTGTSRSELERVALLRFWRMNLASLNRLSQSVSPMYISEISRITNGRINSERNHRQYSRRMGSSGSTHSKATTSITISAGT